jgi:hypothetical protein
MFLVLNILGSITYLNIVIIARDYAAIGKKVSEFSSRDKRLAWEKHYTKSPKKPDITMFFHEAISVQGNDFSKINHILIFYFRFL